MPVELTELPDERLSGPVEAAAYYVVAEAVTNVAKYARASHVTVSVRRSNGNATVEVADDGIGGADASRGTGLRGLADRLEALDGHLEVDSPPSAAPASAPRSRVRSDGYAASGGGPLSSHSPPSRRRTPRFASRVSAAETDGRRAATRWLMTSCVSRSRRWTPSGWTVP